MVYQAGNMLLQEVQRLHQGKVNDVIICQDLAADTQVYYTVINIKEHTIAKKIVELYEDAGEGARKTYITGFSWKQSYMLIFPYHKEHKITASPTLETACPCHSALTSPEALVLPDIR